MDRKKKRREYQSPALFLFALILPVNLASGASVNDADDQSPVIYPVNDSVFTDTQTEKIGLAPHLLDVT